MGDGDIYLACFDRELAPQFVRAFGGAGFIEGPLGMSVGPELVFVVGQFNSEWAEPAITTESVWDGFVTAWRRDDGELAWGHSLGSPVSRATCVAADERGGAFVGGVVETAELGGLPVEEAGGHDAFAARYRADGSVAWAASGGGPNEDEAWAIAAGPDGLVAIAGYFGTSATFGDDALATPSPGSDAFVHVLRGLSE